MTEALAGILAWVLAFLVSTEREYHKPYPRLPAFLPPLLVVVGIALMLRAGH